MTLRDDVLDEAAHLPRTERRAVAALTSLGQMHLSDFSRSRREE